MSLISFLALSFPLVFAVVALAQENATSAKIINIQQEKITRAQGKCKEYRGILVYQDTTLACFPSDRPDINAGHSDMPEHPITQTPHLQLNRAQS
jgi:hypothetical protein